MCVSVSGCPEFMALLSVGGWLGGVGLLGTACAIRKGDEQVLLTTFDSSKRVLGRSAGLHAYIENLYKPCSNPNYPYY